MNLTWKIKFCWLNKKSHFKIRNTAQKSESFSFRKDLHCTKKWSFPLRFSSVNVTKSVAICWFGHIYWRNLNGKLHFLCSVTKFWKIFITHFDSNNNSSIVFNRSFYSLLITACLQNIHASCGCLRKKLTNWTTW